MITKIIKRITTIILLIILIIIKIHVMIKIIVIIIKIIIIMTKIVTIIIIIIIIVKMIITIVIMMKIIMKMIVIKRTRNITISIKSPPPSQLKTRDEILRTHTSTFPHSHSTRPYFPMTTDS